MKKILKQTIAMLLVTLFSQAALAMEASYERKWEARGYDESKIAQSWDFDLQKPRYLDNLDFAKFLTRFKNAVYLKIVNFGLNVYPESTYPAAYKIFLNAYWLHDQFKDSAIDFEPYVIELSRQLEAVNFYELNPVTAYRDYFKSHNLPCNLNESAPR